MQILTELQIDGNQLVSFGSEIDWASKMTLAFESPDAEQCIVRINKWLSELPIYPWGNLADYQEYANDTELAMKDPIIYANIQEYVEAASEVAFSFLPMKIGYLTISFTFRQLPEVHAPLDEVITEVEQDQFAELTPELRAEAIYNTQQEHDITVSIQSTKLGLLVPAHTNHDGELIENAVKTSVRFSYKNVTISQFASLALQHTLTFVGNTPEEKVLLASVNERYNNLVEELLLQLPPVGCTFKPGFTGDGYKDEEMGLFLSYSITPKTEA